MKNPSLLNTIRNWKHLAEEARYRAASLAELCHVSLRTLQRFFHQRRHICLREWLEKLRTQTAEKFLRTEKRIKEIADVLGYEKIPQFSRWFKLGHGVSPRAWRNLLA